MYRNLLNWLTILLVLPSCSGTSPTISVVCEENNVGNAIIKWETAPILKGQVKVYASTSPDFIPEENPEDPEEKRFRVTYSVQTKDAYWKSDNGEPWEDDWILNKYTYVRLEKDITRYRLVNLGPRL